MADPIRQLLSQTSYMADGVNTVWNFSFSGGYLDKSHVKARYLDSASVLQSIAVTSGMFTGPYQLTISPAVPAGRELTIYRDTPKNMPLVDFADKAVLTEASLDLNAKQAVFVAAESSDLLVTTIASTSQIATSLAATVAAADRAATSEGYALAYMNHMKGTNYGPLAADPTLDPLGAVPTLGDEYFNTTVNRKRVYRDTGWEDYEANSLAYATAAWQSKQDAAASATTATAQAGVSWTQAAAAIAAKSQAELARDAALIGANVFASTGEALASAIAVGAYFKVIGSGDYAAQEYQRTGASTFVAVGPGYPSATAVALKAQASLSKNLFNPLAPDVAIGFFPVHTTGALQAAPLYNCSGFVPVVAGAVYSLSLKHYLVWYTAAKVYISGTSDQSSAAVTATAPAGAAFARFSARAGADWNVLQFEQSPTRTAYEPYGAYLVPEQVKDRSLTSSKYADGSVMPISTSFIKSGKNLFNKATVVAGAFMGPDGVVTANAGFNYSDLIPVVPGTSYVSSGTSMRFVTYFSTPTLVVAPGINADTSIFTAPAGVYYVRITQAAGFLPVFQLEAGTVSTAYEPFGFKLRISSDVSLTADISDAAVTTAKLAPLAVTPDKTSFLQPGKNLFNKAAATLASFMAPDGTVVSNQGNFFFSDYMAVTPGVTYYGKGSTGQMRFATYFSAGKVAQPGGNNGDHSTFTVPAGIAFVRVTGYTADLSSFQFEASAVQTSYEAFGFVLRTLTGEGISVATPTGALSLWATKTWGTLGDSITAGGGWQPAVAAKLGLAWTNFGAGGTALYGASGSTSAMCQDARINAMPTTLDLVTVLAGTNDWAQNCPLGAATSTDPLTFNGALNTLMAKLSVRFATKRIALGTTTYGELYNRSAGDGWANAWTNAIGLSTNDYAEAVRGACKRWGVPCIDFAGKAGWNTANIRTFVGDDGGLLHPNTTGYRRMSEVILGTLRDIEPLV